MKRPGLVALGTAIVLLLGVILLRAPSEGNIEKQQDRSNPTLQRNITPEAEVSKFSVSTQKKKHSLRIQLSEPQLRAKREAMELKGRRDLRDKDSGPEQLAAVIADSQPSPEELASMSSYEIVSEIAESPIALDFVHQAGPEQQFRQFSSHHKGVDILLQRDDAANALLTKYAELNTAIPTPPVQSPIDLGAFTFSFGVLESMLASNAALDQFETNDQKRSVVSAIVNSVDARSTYDSAQDEPLHGEAVLMYSATAIGRYLEALNDPKFVEWRRQQNNALFETQPPTPEQSSEILQIARNYLAIP